MDRVGRVSLATLGFAVLWSALVPLGGLTLPLYSTSEETPSGVTTGSETLVEANGSGILIVLCVPLLVSLAVAGLLVLRTRPAAIAAWALTAVLLGATGIALLSVGIFVLPVPIALAVACAATRAPPPTRAATPFAG